MSALLSLGALLWRNKAAILLGAAAVTGTLAAGVQSVRLAQAKSETAQAQLAFADSVPQTRRPDPSLLLPCVDPALVENPETASDNEIAAERLRMAEAYLACKRRHADLAAFVRG